jgi:FdhD protein
LCGKKSAKSIFKGIQAVTRTANIDLPIIESIYHNMRAKQILFSQTGGAHTAAACDENGRILAQFEDIGRHNAVDKVIGYCLEKNCLHNISILSLSSRISLEIVIKCARAGIPILTAISAPSSLAISKAKAWNISLAGFCREGRATFYSGCGRIKTPSFKVS